MRRVERRVRGAAARLPRGYFCARNQLAQQPEARCPPLPPVLTGHVSSLLPY